MNKNRAEIKQMIELAGLNWEDPESINIKWFGKDFDTLHSILKLFYPDCDIDKLAFLFMCYDYLENQIRMLIEADGYAYDKSKWILKQYFTNIIGGVPDFLNPAWENETYLDNRKWNEPEFGDTEEWLDYIEAVRDMYRNGLTDKTLKTINYMKRLQTQYLNR